MHARPAAVLLPASTADIQEAVSFAAARGLRLVARGAGHSTYGQSQAAGGIVVDMTTLAAVREVEPGHAVVAAGTLWSQVVDAARAAGQTPPVLTDYLATTVGGTLSVGGFGGASHRHGAQTDNVTALEVVTGTGELTTCSATENRDLFDSVRGGLGRFGVITAATLRLTPAFDNTRWYKLWYDDLAVFLTDQSRLVAEARCAHVQGRIVPAGNGSWRYRIELAEHYDRPHPPDDHELLRGLRHTPGAEETEDLTHADFLDRMADGERRLRAAGDWFHPHPWLNLMLPSATTESFVRRALGTLTGESLGRAGLVLVYPLPTRHLATPLVRRPAGATAFMVALLRTARPGTQHTSIAANRALYGHALAAGAVAYPTNALPMSPEDWRRHYGPRWPDVVRAGRRFDPRGVLAPGHGTQAG
ncbi:FAD-binding protein [Streptomyces sp. NPDC101175]|uniref:FAD-binding protein n=1 Tax=Streptomyces sp. NPDC101175 TaxID=3366123 RepID=UPI0038396819